MNFQSFLLSDAYFHRPIKDCLFLRLKNEKCWAIKIDESSIWHVTCLKFGFFGDSQQGRVGTTTILVRAFWNFKLEVLKYPQNSRLHATLITNLVKPLMYLDSSSFLLQLIGYSIWQNWWISILSLKNWSFINCSAFD